MSESPTVTLQSVQFPVGDYEWTVIPKEYAEERLKDPQSWQQLHDTYWRIRRKLESLGMTDFLGQLHEEVDRIFTLYASGQANEENPKPLRVYYKIKDPNWKTPGKGWEWVIIAGLVFEGRLIAEGKDSVRWGLANYIREFAEDLQGDLRDVTLIPIDLTVRESQRHEGRKQTDARLQCLLIKVTEGKVTEADRYFDDHLAIRSYVSTCLQLVDIEDDDSWVREEIQSRYPDKDADALDRAVAWTMTKCVGAVSHPSTLGKPLLADLHEIFVEAYENAGNAYLNDWETPLEELVDRWKKGRKQDKDWTPRLIAAGIVERPRAVTEQIAAQLAKKIDKPMFLSLWEIQRGFALDDAMTGRKVIQKYVSELQADTNRFWSCYA